MQNPPKNENVQYVINCRDNIIAPGFVLGILENGVNLDKRGKEAAEKLFCLSSMLPTIPAGVLLDLVWGKRKYTHDVKKETITILAEGE